MKNWIDELLYDNQKDESLESIKKQGPIFTELRNFLGFSEIKTHVFAMICILRTERGTSFNELIEVASSYIQTPAIKTIIEELLTDGWLYTKTHREHELLMLTDEVELALKKANPKLLPNSLKDPENRIMRRICVAAKNLNNGHRSLQDWNEFVQRLTTDKRLKLVHYLASYTLKAQEKALLLYITAQYINMSEPVNLDSIGKIFSQDKVAFFVLKNKLLSANNPLVKEGLLEKDFFISLQYSFKPSAALLQVCIPAVTFEAPTPKLHTALKPLDVDKFRPKDLFYNESDNQQIALIRDILAPEREKTYKELIAQHEQFSGLTIMLSGGPGVGKTELVKQIALRSGRGLFLFDPSKQRSKWFGESEKAIQTIFEDYRKVAQQAALTPILFFNEADSIIGKRTDSENSTSNTENVIQTILLQELEQFDGILICTTNRPSSFDEAFNRRFIFQLHISPPDQKTRFALLSHRYPALTTAQAEELSNYTFTAAELDNFKRQQLIEQLARPNPSPLYEAMLRFLQELKTSQTYNQIGYQ